MNALERQILEQLHKLTPEQQQQVLDFTNALITPQGESAENLFSWIGSFSEGELADMKHAIEEDCEKIDHNEW